MNTKINNKNGFSLIELVLVMALLAFLGVGAFTLMMASNQATQRMTETQENQSELRVAASYITTRLRQNDTSGAVSLRSHENLPSEALVIEELYFGEIFENWIYLDDGILKEIIISPGQELREDFSYTIAEIDLFVVELDKELSGIWISVGRNNDSSPKTVEWFHHIKSKGENHQISFNAGGELVE